MSNDISLLMDGELENEAAATVLIQLKRAAELQECWSTYHLIGDTLRESAALSPNFSTQMAQRLAAEPTILAPRVSASRGWLHNKTVALSAAASIFAVAIVAWVTLQQPSAKPDASLAVQQQNSPEAKVAATTLPPEEVKEYLIAHQEFSPSTAIQGVAPYVRTVSGSQQDINR